MIDQLLEFLHRSLLQHHDPEKAEIFQNLQGLVEQENHKMRHDSIPVQTMDDDDDVSRMMEV